MRQNRGVNQVNLKIKKTNDNLRFEDEQGTNDALVEDEGMKQSLESGKSALVKRKWRKDL